MAVCNNAPIPEKMNAMATNAAVLLQSYHRALSSFEVQETNDSQAFAGLATDRRMQLLLAAAILVGYCT